MRKIASAIMIILVLGVINAQAINWDGGPSGTGTSWNNDVNWSGDVKPGSSDTALFGLAGLSDGKVITLGAPQVVDTLNVNPNWSQVPNITIGSGTDVAAGNTLTVTTVKHDGPNTGAIQTIAANVILAANSIWSVMQGYGGNNTHVVVTGAISGDGKSLTKTSNGLLKLCGANTYSGVTTVSDGYLEVGDGTRTGSIAGDIVNNAGLTFNPGSAGIVTSANISGTGSLTKSGAGTLVIGGSTSATCAGSFTINAGGLDTTVLNLALGNSSYGWNGDFTYVGSENLDLGSGNVTLSADRTVTVKNKTLSVGGIISGSRKLTKQGDGVLEMRAQNTYSSGTVVNNGTLLLKNNGSVGTSYLTINNEGTVILDNTAANTNRIGDGAAVTLAGKMSVLGNETEATSETAGVLTHGSGAAGITLSPGLGQSVLLTFASLAARSTGFSALYFGNGLGSPLGANTSNIKFTTPPTASTYGAFAALDGIGTLGTINAAVLRGVLFDATDTGTGIGFATYDGAANGVRLLDSSTEQTTTYAAGNANVRLDLSDDVAITGDASNTLQLDNTSGSEKTVTNSGTSLIPQNGLLFSGSNPITLTGGTLNANLDANNKEAIILSCNTAGTTIGTAITGDNITLGGSVDMALNATLTAATYGSGYIRINTPGTVTLSSTANGALIINDGTLKLSTDAKLYEADSIGSWDHCYVNINPRGILDLNGISAKSNGIKGTGGITNSSETLATMTCDWRPSGSNYATYSPGFSGDIDGNIKLVVTGSGWYIYNYTQTLSGNNTFTGGVTLGSAGMTLSINSPTALGTGPLTIGGSKLNSNGQVLTTDNAIALNNSFTFKGSASLDLGAGAVTLGAANPTITVSANTLTFGGPIGEGAAGQGFTKAGDGTLVINGVNTYTGTTAVNAGVLTVGSGGTLGSGDISVANGANLTLDGNDGLDDKANLTVVSGGVVTLNNTIPEQIGTLTLNGVVQPATGTYGAVGSGAVFESADFEGTGKLKFAPMGTIIVVK
jgi:fibronectin-binding autotransporter adhesin